MKTAHTGLTGSEVLLGIDLPDSTVLSFWRWAFSNLMSNDLRGIYAEWMVAQILGIELGARISWDGWDLTGPGGVRIEVKASGYLQDWAPERPSKKVVFTNLRSRKWTPEAGYATTPSFAADLYVFCAQTETDQEKWNALDLVQWEFYLLPREVLQKRGCASISLGALRSLARPLSAEEFANTARESILGVITAGSTVLGAPSPVIK